MSSIMFMVLAVLISPNNCTINMTLHAFTNINIPLPLLYSEMNTVNDKNLFILTCGDIDVLIISLLTKAQCVVYIWYFPAHPHHQTGKLMCFQWLHFLCFGWFLFYIFYLFMKNDFSMLYHFFVLWVLQILYYWHGCFSPWLFKLHFFSQTSVTP